MRMVKSLLLGSAAGLVAVAGAQAADLPVKAKPVEYVKVCSLYGAGFWYVPGTDTCLKIGSYVRVQTAWNAEGGGIPTGMGTAGGQQTRTDTSDLNLRTRAALSIDLRTQTEYGTLRSYLEVGAEYTTTSTPTTANAVFFDRGFIQFAGFTAGRIRSYFDINSLAPYSYSNNRVNGDTGASGLYGIAYTAQFGNGVTASLSFEDGGASSNGNSNGGSSTRGHMVSNLSLTEFNLGSTSFDNAGWRFPDVVGALRIDQAWGYAQIAAALHDASGGLYTGAPGGCGAATNFCVTNGHPDDKIGFAVTGGFTLNDVLGLRGDQFGVQAAYSQGAAGYVTRATAAWAPYGNGNNAGFAWITDGTFINGGSVELTTVWGVNAFFQHFWNPKWRTSLWGGYVAVDYSDQQKTDMCGAAVGGPVALVRGVGIANVTNCNPDSSWFQVGSRTQWNPHPDLDIGLEVLYTKLNTAFGGQALLPASGARPAGTYNIDDQDIVSVLFRIQRNFLP